MARRNMQGALIQQRRRRILSLLPDAYPRQLEGSVIAELLLKHGPDSTEDDVEKDLAYLMESDKGYVETVGATTRKPWRNRFYKLTGRGNEVANRLVSDPALGYGD